MQLTISLVTVFPHSTWKAHTLNQQFVNQQFDPKFRGKMLHLYTVQYNVDSVPHMYVVCIPS